MTWKKNIVKSDRIKKFGQTIDLPLFNQDLSLPKPSDDKTPEEIKIPDWIWDGSSVKAEVYNKMKEKFAEDSLLYLRAIITLGGKATDHEVAEYFNDWQQWPLHIVSARRNYWTGSPYYVIQSFPDRTKQGPRGRPNTIWYVNFSNLYLLIKSEE